jgi:D-alanine-D-alanine ligase
MTAPAPPLCFPLLVKHFSSYASVGLTKDSKVGNVADLATQCSRMLRTYGGCLVEEFIEGREFTVLVAQECAQGQRRIDGNDKDGNAVADHEAELRVVAYDPVECHFGPGECFKHFNLKWVDYESIGWQGLSQQDPELSERLKATAVGVFRAMLGRGYARLDFRSDSTGQSVYFLEINPNCGILYPEGSYGSADFILDRHCPRTAHAEFVLNQIEVAKHLWSLKNARACEARYDSKSQSWGLYSTRNLKVGDLILDLEEKPMHLVSKSHVLRTWQTWDDGKSRLGSAEMRSWSNFCSYCWPVSDDLFAMWSPRPEDWQPINHSCDPNAWNEAPNGLNVVARTPIRSGEEIRMDYATFCGYFKEMKTFVCHCQAADCRGEITGMDILKPEVALKYEGHTTSYVASKAHQFHRRILDTIEPVA